MKDKLERIRAFLINAVKESRAFDIFAGEGIQKSFLFRAMSLPSAVLAKVCDEYGGKIGGSFFAGKNALKFCVLAFMAIVPSNSCGVPILGAATVFLYILRAASEQGFAKPPRPLDALVVIFAVIFAAISGGVSLYGVFALVIYLVLAKSVDEAFWQEAVCVFMLGTLISAVFGKITKGGFYTEFYALTIPFGLAAAREMEKTPKILTYGFSALLALTFATTLSKGTITLAGIAVLVFLCIRDLRFLLIGVAALGIFGDELAAAGAYSFSFVSGVLTLIMSGVFYLNLINYSSRRRFLRSAVAALGSGSAVFLSSGGEGGMEFMFFAILALLSTNIKTKK